MRRFGILGLAVMSAAVLLVLPATVPAQSNQKTVTTIRVTVLVQDSEGKPLPNAGVVLRQSTVLQGRMSKDPFNVEIHTNDKGQAVVQGFAPGIVLVQVIAHGYQTYGQGFIMKDADETVHVKLKMPKPQVTIYHP